MSAKRRMLSFLWSERVMVVIVVVVIAIPAAPRLIIALFGFSKLEVAEAQCKEYYDAAIVWQRIRGEWPDSLEEMDKPANPGEESFIDVRNDPWGYPFVLELKAEGLLVRSFGPDGERETADDIICAGEE